MRQAIHIFRKDAKHCWPYIAGVMALTAVNAWLNCRDTPDFPQLNPGQFLVPLLMTVAWWLAIGAAVHGESPIGDRQFWVTRPYSWKSLLAAKFLFLAAFLGLPLFISDCVILLASGFNPLTLLPGLLWRQCWLAALLVVPFVIAVLTRLTREFISVGLLFTLVFGIATFYVGLLLALLPGSRSHQAPLWIVDAAVWLALPAGLALAAWQYARRRTGLVRALAIALGALTSVLVTASYASRILMITHPTPPVYSRYENVTFQFAPDPGQPGPGNTLGQASGQINVPLRVSGWPRELVSPQVSLVTVWDHSGRMLASGQFPNLDRTFGSDGRDWIEFLIDDYSRRTVPAGEVDLRVTLEVKIYERVGSVYLQSQGGWSYVPGFGAVRLMDDSRGRSHLTWRAALKPAEPEWNYTLGDAVSGEIKNGEWGGLVHVPRSSPFWFQMSPVTSYPGSVATPASGALPLLFTARHLVATLHRELTIPQIRLAEYEAGAS